MIFFLCQKRNNFFHEILSKIEFDLNREKNNHTNKKSLGIKLQQENSITQRNLFRIDSTFYNQV